MLRPNRHEPFAHSFRLTSHEIRNYSILACKHGLIGLVVFVTSEDHCNETVVAAVVKRISSRGQSGL